MNPYNVGKAMKFLVMLVLSPFLLLFQGLLMHNLVTWAFPTTTLSLIQVIIVLLVGRYVVVSALPHRLDEPTDGWLELAVKVAIYSIFTPTVIWGFGALFLSLSIGA